MCKIAFSKQVRKFLIKHPDVAKLFYKKLSSLSENPIYNTEIDISPLEWVKGHYKLRIWKYRFLYEVKKNEVLVYFYYVDSRWDVYKYL
jgi:mRNA interferase RelE/StbE